MDHSPDAGPEAVRRRISAAASRNALSHAWMIVGRDGGQCYETALYLAAAKLCTSSRRPCMTCKNCKKTFSETHPDITVIAPDGRSQGIKVGEARSLIKSAYIKPNDSDGKVFIIKDADDLNPNSANALLKITEEPPSYVTIILLTSSPQGIPATLRSRCETLYLGPGASSAPVDADSAASRFWTMLGNGDELSAAAFAVANEKMGRKDLQELLDGMLRLTAAAAAGAGARERRKLLDMAAVLDRAGALAASSVSPGNVLSYICAGCFEARD